MIESELEGMTAFDTTQYLSGKLFIYIDALLGDQYENIAPDVFCQIETFFKAVIRLIIVWMKKVPTMTKTL